MKVARLKKTIAVRGRGPHCRRAVHVTCSSLACLQCRSLSRVQLEAESQGLTPSVTLWIQSTPRIRFPLLTQDPCQHVAVVRPAPWPRLSHGTMLGRSFNQPSARPKHGNATLASPSPTSAQRPNQHRALCTAAAPPHAISSTGAFRSLRSARVDGVVVRASEKLHKSCREQVREEPCPGLDPRRRGGGATGNACRLCCRRCCFNPRPRGVVSQFEI